METKDGFVLDRSVTMAWCFDDEATPYTDGVRDSLADFATHPTRLKAGAATGLEKSEKRGVQAARNGPSEDGKCWQRVEPGIHSLNRWLVKC